MVSAKRDHTVLHVTNARVITTMAEPRLESHVRSLL